MIAETAAQDPPASARRDWMSVAVCALPLVIAVVLFGSAFADDAYITFGSARRLADGSFTNYNGDRLEQSSSLLHVLVLAATHVVSRLSLPWVAWIVGLFGAAATVAATMRLSRRVAPERSPWPAGVLVGTSVPLVYWSVGGLETTLVSWLLTAAVSTLIGRTTGQTQSRRAELAMAAAVAGYVASRPEAAIVLAAGLAASLLAAWWLTGRTAAACRDAARSALPGALSIVGAGIVVTTVRLIFTGRVWPNPVSAKVRGLDVRRGVTYVVTSLDRVSTVALFCGLLVAAAGTIHGWRRRDARVVSVAAFVVAAGGAVVATGGDWMVGGRFLAPLIPLVAVLANSVGLRWRHALAGVVVLHCTGLLVFSITDSRGVPLWASAQSGLTDARSADGWPESRSRGAWSDLATAPRLTELVDELGGRIGRPVVVASGQAGMTMYYLLSRTDLEVRFVDRFQLSTDDFGRCDDLLQRSVYGATISYATWAANETRCDVRMPDIVFELGRFEDFEGLDEYTLVYQQEGTVDLSTAPFGAVEVLAVQFLAVRTELVAAR